MKRSELYARVWSIPVTKIAHEVGVTGTRVAAICRQHGIPTPPRGYWSKLSVGKQPPTTPLPSPEADYEIKVGAPPGRQRPSTWAAPDGLLRPPAEARVEAESVAAVDGRLEPCATDEQSISKRAPVKLVKPSQPTISLQIDLELVRAAATELQRIQAIRELLQAIATQAVLAPADEANRILSWVAAVRERLEAHNPVTALIRLATQTP